MAKNKNIVLTSKEVNERGRILLQQLRNIGVWQYSRWFVERDNRYNGDGAIQDRMQRIFNERGVPTDTNLLMDMEDIVAKHLAK